MSYKIGLKTKAVSLRKKGYSLKEISLRLKISKSTASFWLSAVPLSDKAQTRLAKKQILGQYKTVLLKQKNKERLLKKLNMKAFNILKKVPISKDLAKLCCALIWWCEGNKHSTFVRFTSSDPSLIGNFLSLFRSGFEIEESKFRALVHLHKYHNDEVQKVFWSKITSIPKTQFYKSYLKLNTGKRIHKDYPGCIAVSYYDAKIAKELEALYNSFTKMQGGVR